MSFRVERMAVECDIRTRKSNFFFNAYPTEEFITTLTAALKSSRRVTYFLSPEQTSDQRYAYTLTVPCVERGRVNFQIYRVETQTELLQTLSEALGRGIFLHRGENTRIDGGKEWRSLSATTGAQLFSHALQLT